MIEDVVDYINKKITINKDYIRITFYELRVKYNLSEEETEEFLEDVKALLEEKGYLVYFTDEKYYYRNAKTIVQPNELMIAIKKEEQMEII